MEKVLKVRKESNWKLNLKKPTYKFVGNLIVGVLLGMCFITFLMNIGFWSGISLGILVTVLGYNVKEVSIED